jgi:lipopolysaccharide biosynthesis glycosyltransferase
MACDRDYLYPWAVSMLSATRHSDEPLDIWFGLAADWSQRLSQHELDCVRALVESTGATARFVTVPVDTTGLPSSSYISPTAFVKMGMFDSCPSDAVMVWLDSDLTIRAPWREAIDLGRGHAASGVREHNPIFEERWSTGPRDWYVNTGVVVVAGKEWQATFSEAWRPLLAQYSQHGFRYMDQDVLNAAIRERWNVLPETFNFRPIHTPEWADPVVVHFAGRYKPWMATPVQYRLLRQSWRPAFDAYFEAEQCLADHLATKVDRDVRTFWKGQQRRTRGIASSRAWLHYGKVLVQGALALN